MSISSIFPTTSAADIQNWQAMKHQRQQDLQGLASSLKSGDLSGAQQAYSDLQSIASANVSTTAPASQTGPVQQAFAALGQDLAAGNLSQAQKDLTKINDLRSVLLKNGGAALHQHGHHDHKIDLSSLQSTTPPSTDSIFSSAASSLFSQYTSANAAGNSTTSSLLNLMA